MTSSQLTIISHTVPAPRPTINRPKSNISTELAIPHVPNRTDAITFSEALNNNAFFLQAIYQDCFFLLVFKLKV